MLHGLVFNALSIERYLAFPFFGIGMKSDLFQFRGHCWVSEFAGILSVAFQQHHLLGFEIAQLEFHHLLHQHHRLDAHEFERTLEIGDGQGSLACCSPWRCRVGHDWATELKYWLKTKFNWVNLKTWLVLFKDVCVCLVTQSCLTLCDPRDCSPPGSSVCEILQVRTLEWVAMPSSRGSSQPRDRTQVFCNVGRFFPLWVTREAHESNK